MFLISLALVLGLVLIGCPQPTDSDGGGSGSGSSSGSGSDSGTGSGSDSTFVPVTDITGVVTNAVKNIAVTLTGTVAPNTATNTDIVWSVKDAGTTAVTTAEVEDGTFTPTSAGTLKVTATIENGTAAGTDYTKDFTITVAEPQVGDTGPGGGIIFQVGTADNGYVYKEVSERLLKDGSDEMNWEDAKATAEAYTGGGVSWYLPSKEELNEVYLALKENRDPPLIDETGYLWSSSESDNKYAWKQRFNSYGTQILDVKTASNGVRAIRAF